MDSIYHIETDIQCRVLHYGTEICVATPGEDVAINLRKGKHKLTFVSVENSSDQYSILHEVPENDIEDFISVALFPHKDSRIAEERKRQELEFKRIEEERKKQEESLRLKQQEERRLEEEKRKRERERLERMWEIRTSDDKIIFYKDDVQFTMVRVPGGTFIMGNNTTNIHNYGNDYPAHKVFLDSFYISEEIVLRKIFGKVSFHSRWNSISEPETPFCEDWYRCKSFLKELSLVTGRDFSFPTEAQWEYAMSKRAECGIIINTELYEWSRDFYSPTYYHCSPQTNPMGPEEGLYKSYRNPQNITERLFARPYDSFPNLGLRLCL